MTANLLPHQQRVITERDELQTKLRALTVFLDSNVTYATLPKQEQELLQRQEGIMRNYVTVLNQRIALFVPEDNDFPLGNACDLSGEGTCEACQ
jgi:hypothetical protein